MTVILIIVITLIAGLWYVDSSCQARKINTLKQENEFRIKINTSQKDTIHSLLLQNQRLRDAITDIHSIQPDSVLDQYTEPQ